MSGRAAAVWGYVARTTVARIAPAALLGIFALTACKPEPSGPPDASGPPAMVGLSQGSHLTFTRSPNGEVMSVLYDAAVLDWVPAEPVTTNGQKDLSGSFTIEATGTPQDLRIWVRGFRMGPPPDGATLKFKVAGKVSDLTPQLNEENYLACIDLPLAQASTRIEWTANLAQAPGETSKLTIDTIDMALPDKDTAPLPATGCPEAPPRPTPDPG